MLVHIKEIIPKAVKGNYAVPAFNTFNLETTLAIVRGAVAEKSPVIIQISEKTVQYAGLKPITHIMETIAKNEAVTVPVALHLDHGKSFHSVAECIHAGFTSIHIDASELPFDENVALTKQSTDYAHKHKCWAQGELGRVLGKKDLSNKKIIDQIKESMTNPEQAEKFVKATNIDSFAPSVGAAHGIFKDQEKIDQNLLKDISSKTKLPLVLHGASGVSSADIKLAIKNGVAVINIDTKLRQVFTNRLRQTLMSKVHEIDPRNILIPSINATQKTIQEKIRLFGSSNKA